MKDFAEAYKEARAKEREYSEAKRAGWAEAGKRTRDNHAILVPRREAVAMADELASAVFAKEVFLTWMLNLQGFIEKLATGEPDAVKCRGCGHTFRTEWMDGRCPYCEAQKEATRQVEETRDTARK